MSSKSHFVVHPGWHAIETGTTPDSICSGRISGDWLTIIHRAGRILLLRGVLRDNRLEAHFYAKLGIEMDDMEFDQPEQIEAETIELHAGMIDRIEGEEIRIQNGGANTVTAANVDMHTAGAVNVQGLQVDLHQSGVGIIEGNQVSLDRSSGVVVLADHLESSESRIGVSLANTANFRNSSPFFVFAREVKGDIEPVIDQRAAISIGVIAGLVVGFFLLLANLFGKRKRN